MNVLAGDMGGAGKRHGCQFCGGEANLKLLIPFGVGGDEGGGVTLQVGTLSYSRAVRHRASISGYDVRGDVASIGPRADELNVGSKLSKLDSPSLLGKGCWVNCRQGGQGHRRQRSGRGRDRGGGRRGRSGGDGTPRALHVPGFAAFTGHTRQPC